MTTIAYREPTLAGDTRAYSGHSTPIGEKQKVWKHPRTGAMIGISTSKPGLGEQIGAWFCDDKNPDLMPDIPHDDGMDAIEVDEHGNVFIYHCSMNPTGPLQAPFFAVGSGANFALGAFYMGADAIEAVKVGIECDPWSGGRVISITNPDLVADGDADVPDAA